MKGPVQWMGLAICSGMTVRSMGMLGVSEKDEGTDCEDGDSDTDWLRYTESYMLLACLALTNLALRGPCIVIYSYNKTDEMH